MLSSTPSSSYKDFSLSFSTSRILRDPPLLFIGPHTYHSLLPFIVVASPWLISLFVFYFSVLLSSMTYIVILPLSLNNLGNSWAPKVFLLFYQILTDLVILNQLLHLMNEGTRAGQVDFLSHLLFFLKFLLFLFLFIWGQNSFWRTLF